MRLITNLTPRVYFVCALLWCLCQPRPVAAASDKPIELRYMGPGGIVAGAFDDVIRAFEKRSDEKHAKDPAYSRYRIISGQDAAYDMTGDPTRFLISVAGGMPPDIVKFDRFAIAEWAARNAFLPLDDYIASSDDINTSTRIRREDFYPNAIQEATYQGRTYAIPTEIDSRALIYNKDLLKRAGLVDPQTGEAKPPVTWDELREYANKLTRRDSSGKIQTLGFVPNYGNSWLYMFGFMAGAQFMSADGITVMMNEPAVVRALTYMRDIYDDLGGYKEVQGFQATFQGGFLDPFVTGKVAMRIDSSWYVAWLAQYGRDVDFGVAPPPMPIDRLDKGPVSWSGGWSFAIPANAHHPHAAWEFIRFAASVEGQRIYAEGERDALDAIGYPYVPGFTPYPHLNEELLQKYVMQDPRISVRMREGTQNFLALLPHTKYRPVTPVAQLLWTHQVSAMEEALYHRRTPQAALDYHNAVVQRDLDQRLKPPEGRPIKSQWFIGAYSLLLVGVIATVYLFDTRPRFRLFLARLFGSKRSIGDGDVVEGARGGYFRSQWRGGILCTLPWILGFIIFQGGPLLFSALMSFCDYDVLSPPRLIGLQNYKVLFTEDELAPQALYNTVFMMLRIPVNMAAGLSLALLLDMKLRGMPFFRTIFYLPAVLPAIAGFILWMWIFNPVSGPLNTMLASIGIAGPHWLADENWAKPSIMLMSLWGVGGGMIIWLAGLRSINHNLYEAASLDGAGPWKQFLHVTIPQLSPYIFFNLIMSLIDGFKIFDEAFIMTHGGPVNSTRFYVYHLFDHAFRFGHMGYASAMAWMLFILIVTFTIIQMRLAKRWVHYEHE